MKKRILSHHIKCEKYCGRKILRVENLSGGKGSRHKNLWEKIKIMLRPKGWMGVDQK